MGFEPALTDKEYAAIYNRVYRGKTAEWSECARETRYRRLVAEAVAAKLGKRLEDVHYVFREEKPMAKKRARRDVVTGETVRALRKIVVEDE